MPLCQQQVYEGAEVKALISKGSTCKAATFVPQRAVAVHSCSDALEHHLKTHMAGLLIINKGERWKNVPARRWRPPAGGL